MWGNRFQELLTCEFLVSVEIGASNKRIVVLVGRLAEHRVEEALQIFLLDRVDTAIIDRVEGGVGAETFLSLQFLLELLRVSVHFDLHQDELCKFFLHVQGQVVILSTDHVGSLSGLCSQPTVGARQDDLHEVGVVEKAILVRVKELDQVVTVRLRYIVRQTVVSDKV